MIVHERASVPDEPVKVRPVAVKAVSEATPWTDPPAKPILAVAETAAPAAATAAVAEPEPVAEPVAFTPPVVQAPVQHTALKSDKAKRAAEQAKRRKLAQAKARRTQTASREIPAEQIEAPEPTPQVAPAPARNADPIGDLLRGLGIGRQG